MSNRQDLTQAEKDLRTIQKLRDENRKLRGRERTIFRSGLTAESAVAELKEFLTTDISNVFTLDCAPVPKVASRSMFDPNHTEVMALNLGDWHIAETVNPLAVNGLNEHNTLIAAGKLWRIAEKFLRIVRRHETMYNISSVWIPVLGDMISGSIHKELELSNDLLDIPATILAARLLIMVLLRVKTLGKPIRVDAVIGNHPRTLENMPTKMQAQTNYDWMCYEMVRSYFEAAKDELVTVNVHQSQQAIVNVMGHNVVVEHLYGYSHAKVTDVDARLRGVFDHPDVRAFLGHTGRSVDFVVGGDHHRGFVSDHAMINQSLVGASELSTAWRLKPIKAGQQCWGISKEHIPTFVYSLTAHSSDCKRLDNPFSKYTSEFMKLYGR